MFGKKTTGTGVQDLIEGVIARLNDDDLYAHVHQEMETGQLDGGVWTRSIAEADGDEDKARARYILNRIRRMKDLAIHAGLEKAAREMAHQERLKVQQQVFEKKQRITDFLNGNPLDPYVRLEHEAVHEKFRADWIAEDPYARKSMSRTDSWKSYFRSLGY